MSILIDKVRIKNFRSLQNVEVDLKPITILVGANNAGKTTFLRAINAVLGINRTQLNRDDLFIDKDGQQLAKNIIIDIRIIPVNEKGDRIENFDNKWTGVFGGAPNFSLDIEGDALSFRTEYQFDLDDNPNTPNFTLITDWDNETLSDVFKDVSKTRECLKMYFLDAQRDLQEDLKLRTSYFGKLVSQIENEYDADAVKELKRLIDLLNITAIEKSTVLKDLSNALASLNKTTNTRGEGVTISPFPKKIRDFHKGMKVDFQDNGSDVFGMEYHGMGTRSWASILTFGAYIDWALKQIENKIEKGEDVNVLFPILALEEPEAHLHPNAQRTLYKQLKGFKGQKIVSTHSPYIAGQAGLDELRHFYKIEDKCSITQIKFSYTEDIKIGVLIKEIDASEKNPEVCKKNYPIIKKLKEEKAGKISALEGEKIKRDVFLNKGELLFARAIVLFEGVTEEEALPIFFEKYYSGVSAFEQGINFISVGGKNGYRPFLILAKFLQIPWIIFSDNDGTTKTDVKSQIMEVFNNDGEDCTIFLDEGMDFEIYLVKSGFLKEINLAIDSIENKENYVLNKYIPELNGQKKKGEIIRDYTGDDKIDIATMDCMGENKTKYSQAIAIEIAKRNNEGTFGSPKIEQLFHKISFRLQLSCALQTNK